MAEYDFPVIQQLLEHQLTEKIEVLVFSDLTDLKQSNIGEDEVFQLSSGETKVLGNAPYSAFSVLYILVLVSNCTWHSNPITASYDSCIIQHKCT